jgi:hypothetical protein
LGQAFLSRETERLSHALILQSNGETLMSASKTKELDHAPPRPRPYPAEKARQGVIILDRPWRRLVFFGALILLVLLAVLIRIAG